MIDAILFDLGDTIINFGIGYAQAQALFGVGAQRTYEYLAARAKPLPEFPRYFRTHYRRMRNEYLWSKLTWRDFNYCVVIRSAGRRLRIPLTAPEIDHLAWLWYEPIFDASHVDAGLHDMLATLRHAGTRLGIVSNTFVPPHCLDRHLSETGLLQFFPVRVYSSQVRYRKPHPRIFEIALQQLNAVAERTLFIGDLLRADIRGARRAGMKTVWLPHTPAARSKWPWHRPEAVIRRITQLPDVLPGLGWHTPASRHSPVALIA